MKVLIVEDEQRVARAIKEGLEQESYAVDVEHNGEDAYLTAKANDYDVILLDVKLPGMDGIAVCKSLRREGVSTPILMLTANDQSEDVIAGLDAGADDYLPKPFAFDVLLARIRALLRRPAKKQDEVLVVDGLSLDPATKGVVRSGKVINLSRKEFAILEYMMRNPRMILSKNNLISHVWDFDADILPNNVEVFINHLRGKIDKPFDGPGLINTVRGFGYRLGAEIE